MENFKAASERPEGAGHIFSPSPRPNWDPTPSGDSSPMRPVSDWKKFGNYTLRPSGKATLAGSGSGQSLVLSPESRTFEKADEDGRGGLGG